MKRIITAAVVLILAVILLCTGISAFDANDYDYGGGSSGGYSYSYEDDDDSGGGDLTSLVLAIVVVAIMCVYWWIKGKIDKHRKKKLEEEHTPKSVPNRTAEINDTVRRFDPTFDSEAMKTYAKKVFKDLYAALNTHNLEPLRDIMVSQLFDYVNSVIRDDSDHNMTNHYENITVMQSWLTSYVRENGREYITVYMNTKYIGYCTDNGTGELLSGNSNTECKQRYLMTFVRNTNVSADSSQFCPHCGAHINAAYPGKCEYCGNSVTAESPGWLLSSWAPVDSDTQDPGIRLC